MFLRPSLDYYNSSTSQRCSFLVLWDFDRSLLRCVWQEFYTTKFLIEIAGQLLHKLWCSSESVISPLPLYEVVCKAIVIECVTIHRFGY